MQLGATTDAMVAFETAAAKGGPRERANLAYAYAVTGRPDEARLQLSLLINDVAALPAGYHIGVAYVGLGDIDAAFA